MTRIVFAALLLALAASPALAKLEIEKVEACYGRLGPVRKSLDIYPYDEIGFRFNVTGAKADDEGAVDVEQVWRVLDDKGKDVFPPKNSALKGPLTFGTDSFSTYVSAWLRETAVGREHTLKVTVKDKLTSEEAGFEKTLKVLPPEHAVVSPQFFHDAARTVPAPAGGVVGQQLQFHLLVIGFDRSQGKLDEELTVRVLDKDKKELSPKPLRITAQKADEKLVKELPAIDFSGWIMLTKPGEFTLSFTATDRNTKKTAGWEVPLKVTAP
jgi:hypothetical protein